MDQPVTHVIDRGEAISLRPGTGYQVVPEYLLEPGAVSSTAVVAWIVLSSCVGGNGQDALLPNGDLFGPTSVVEVAKGMRTSTRTVRRAIAELEKAGAVSVVERYDVDGGRLPNGYRLHRLAPVDVTRDTRVTSRAGEV